jgi:hypothetical protein
VVQRLSARSLTIRILSLLGLGVLGPTTLLNSTVAQDIPPQPRAAQAEVIKAIAALNQAQRSFYARNQSFANTVSTLQAEGKFEVPRRLYNFAVNAAQAQVLHYAIPRSLDWKVYVGGVFVEKTSEFSSSQIVSVICETKTQGNARPADPTFKDGRATCGENSVAIRPPSQTVKP